MLFPDVSQLCRLAGDSVCVGLPDGVSLLIAKAASGGVGEWGNGSMLPLGIIHPYYMFIDQRFMAKTHFDRTRKEKGDQGPERK